MRHFLTIFTQCVQIGNANKIPMRLFLQMLTFGTVLLIALLGIVASNDLPNKNDEKSQNEKDQNRSSQILEYINTQAQRRKYALRFQK